MDQTFKRYKNCLRSTIKNQRPQIAYHLPFRVSLLAQHRNCYLSKFLSFHSNSSSRWPHGSHEWAGPELQLGVTASHPGCLGDEGCFLKGNRDRVVHRIDLLGVDHSRGDASRQHD